MSKTSASVKNRWNSAHYDRINVQVKKGRKEIIQSAAAREGVSVNEWLNRAVFDRLNEEERRKWEEEKEKARE